MPFQTSSYAGDGAKTTASGGSGGTVESTPSDDTRPSDDDGTQGEVPQGGASSAATHPGGDGSGTSSVSENGGVDAATQVEDAAILGTDAATPAGDGAVSGEDAATPVVCPDSPLTPGEHTETLTHDGLRREFLIHVSPSYDNQHALPLVLNFHGRLMTAADQARISQMNPTADAKGFIVVYPQGFENSWNGGVCCGPAQSNNVDDVGFVRALVEYMKQRLCIDPRRIYATGVSNGGRISYRLACEAADIIAAIAPVAGTKSFPDMNNTPGCMPSRPISIIDFMGSADSRYSAQAGQIAEFVALNGCTDVKPLETYRYGEHFCNTYSMCEAGTSVTYCVVNDGGHCWPGSYPCSLGNTSRPEELSANELMWELFSRSTL